MDSLKGKLAKIKAIASDIDGVLTDGNLYLGDDGKARYSFSVQDGMGLRLAMEQGLEFVFISGRMSKAAARRLKGLGVRHVFQDVEDKGPALEQWAKARRLKPEQICAVGDDLADLPLFDKSGVRVAVQNAVQELKAKAHWVTRRDGGNGALREIVEGILKAKGLWQEVLAGFGGAKP